MPYLYLLFIKGNINLKNINISTETTNTIDKTTSI